MNRDELEHMIRAAATVSDEEEIVVIGSQAILGQFPDAPPTLLFSQEADVYPRRRPEKAIMIDGAMGDGSQFTRRSATTPTAWAPRRPRRHAAGRTALYRYTSR